MQRTTTTTAEVITEKLPIIMDGDKIDINATAQALTPIIATQLIAEYEMPDYNTRNKVLAALGDNADFKDRFARHFPLASDGKHDLLMGWDTFMDVVKKITADIGGHIEAQSRADYEKKVMAAAPAHLEKCDYYDQYGKMYRYRGARGWRIISPVVSYDDDDRYKVERKYYSEEQLRRLIGMGIVGPSHWRDDNEDNRPVEIKVCPKLTPTQLKIQADAKAHNVKITHALWGQKWHSTFLVLEGDVYPLYKKHVSWFRKNLKYQWQGREGTFWEDVQGKYWSVRSNRIALCQSVFGDTTDDAFDREEDMEEHPEKYLGKVLYDLIHQRIPLFAKDVLWQTPYVSDDILHYNITDALMTELRCPGTLDSKEFARIIRAIVDNKEIDRTPYIEMCEANGGHTTDEDLELTNPEALM